MWAASFYLTSEPQYRHLEVSTILGLNLNFQLMALITSLLPTMPVVLLPPSPPSWGHISFGAFMSACLPEVQRLLFHRLLLYICIPLSLLRVFSYIYPHGGLSISLRVG